MRASREHIRLFVDAPLVEDVEIRLPQPQAHYLRNVMRREVGGEIGLFNGADGEWRASILALGKHDARIRLNDKIRAQTVTPDLWLLCAAVKRTRLEIIVEKATELGVREIHPVITEYTSAPHVNLERLNAIAIEAAEQCGLLSVPVLHAPEKLNVTLENWSQERRIMFCDESGAGRPALCQLQHTTARNAAWAVLCGPEGGFSPAERSRLLALPQVAPVSLGPRILRADTAAIAALTLWQALCGDWDAAPVAPSR